MNKLSPKEEMIQLINQCLSTRDFSTATQCLDIYQNAFGNDTFCHSCRISITPVTILYIIDSPADTKPALEIPTTSEFHTNSSIIYIHTENLIQEFCDFLSTTTCKYFCFCDSEHKYEKNRIAILLYQLENFPTVNGIIHARNFIKADNTIIAHPDVLYQNALDKQIFDGKLLLDYSILNKVNLYGDLSNIMLSTDYAKQLPLKETDAPASMQSLSLLYQLLSPATIAYTFTPLSSSIVKPASNTSVLISDYKKLLQSCLNSNLISQIPEDIIDFTATEHFIPCKKEITFFYTDMGEYYNLKPIADMAVLRGYHTSFTTDIKQTAEIGIYCQHICYPENAKFSVILLHDLAQGHNRWPNLWEGERWNKFDIGIVPGQFWADLWAECACQYYTNPKCGTYQLGYPKSELITSDTLSQHAHTLKESLNLKYDFSILYAPSWENDNKEDDFVKALASLPVNLLIKQAHWSDEYAHIIQNINEMRSLHEGKYDNVYYIEPEENIMSALSICDLIVSDESSVMAEALLFGKTSIAVTDWLIPDVTPSRYAVVPMDYVIKCQKAELQQNVEQFMHSPESYQSIHENGKRLFSNIGHCCSDILDAIEYFTMTDSDNPSSFLAKRVVSRYSICSLWN